jgi:hypothetical protein
MAVLDDVRRIAMALPEVVETPHFDSSSLRVAGKILCTFGPEGERVVVKFHPEDQRNLVEDDPQTLTAVPGAWGQKGWTHVRIADLDNERLGSLLRLAWATVAPKRLLKGAPPA